MSTFDKPSDAYGKDWLDKKLIHYAPHVVNLSSLKWVVWAPAGKPYPVRDSDKLPHSHSSHVSLQTVETGGSLESSGYIQRSEPPTALTSVDDILGMEEGVGGRRDTCGAVEEGRRGTHGAEEVGRRGTHGVEEVGRRGTHGVEEVGRRGTHGVEEVGRRGTHGAGEVGRSGQEVVHEEVDLLIDFHSEDIPSATMSHSLTTKTPLTTPSDVHVQPLNTSTDTVDLIDFSDGAKIHEPFSGVKPSEQNATRDNPPASQSPVVSGGSGVPLPSTGSEELCKSNAASVPSAAESHSTVSECDESPYDFLQKEPELLAQMDVKQEEEGASTLSTAEALQQLIAAGNTAHDFELPDLPPPILPLPSRNNSSPSNIPLDGTADYLKAGLEPDEVLQELYRVKDSGGGIINPTSMEPFLSYFGELSSRELERLESQQAKSKPPTAPSPTPTKGMLRKKRMMAIRFPGQGPDPYDIDPELQKTLESIQFPDIPNLSDNSDDSDSFPPRPVSRAELLEKLMGDEDFASWPKEGRKDSDTTTGSGGKDELQSYRLPSSGAGERPTPTAASLLPDSEHPSRLPSYPRYYEKGNEEQQ